MVSVSKIFRKDVLDSLLLHSLFKLFRKRQIRRLKLFALVDCCLLLYWYQFILRNEESQITDLDIPI